MGLAYGREKFYQAIDALAASAAPIQKRLVLAATFLIRLKPEEDLPETLHEEFHAVWHELTREQAVGNEGNLEATTRKLTDEDASKLAERIFGMYVELRGGI